MGFHANPPQKQKPSITNEMVERAARALYELKCREIAADPTAPHRGPFEPFERLLKARDHYMQQARAALEAALSGKDHPND